MRTVKYVWWEEDGAWLGYLQDFPDYWTQGETLDDLKEHLRDLYADLTGGQLVGIRTEEEGLRRKRLGAFCGSMALPNDAQQPRAEPSGGGDVDDSPFES